jgi:hypothetical protein
MTKQFWTTNTNVMHAVEEKLDDRIKSDLQIFVFPLYVPRFSNFSCRFQNPFFSNLISKCSNSLDLKNLQEHVKKHLLSKIELTFHCLNKLF